MVSNNRVETASLVTRSPAGAHRKLRRQLLPSLIVMLLATGCVRPEPFSEEVVVQRVGADLASMYANHVPVSGPISLQEAIARALKFNLDKSLKRLERELVDARLDSLQMTMLPQVASRAGWRERDIARGSSSRSLITGKQSLEVSTSEDKEIRIADLHAVWNVLDFGLTYLRSRQEADQVLIAEERRIKTIQNLVQDTRDAYWRAVAAEQLLPDVRAILRSIDDAIARSTRVAASGAGDPSEELKRQHLLLVHKRELTEVRRKLSLSKSELAALMNLPPATDFRMAVAKRSEFKVPHFQGKMDEMTRLALANRPELREEDYKGRIADHELNMAYVRLLPGIELTAGRNFDSNSFLFERHWLDAGAMITKNLMEIAQAPRNIAFAEKNIEVAKARRLALSMAIVTQLHLAVQRFGIAREVFGVTDQLARVDNRLAEIAYTSAQKDGAAAVEAIQAQSQRVVTKLQHFVAWVDVQNAYGRVQNSLGAFRTSPTLETMELAELTEVVRQMLQDWQSAGVVVSSAR